MTQDRRFLNPPIVARVRYPTNYIKTAVCELRFPTLLELEERPPRAFQAKIRKNYPFYEPQIVEQMGDSSRFEPEHRYLFRSQDQKWTVSVKSFALAIETKKYTDFEDFFGRFEKVLETAKDMIDSDFFTRVGLRYMNEIEISDGQLEGWIRKDLVLPVVDGVLGTVKITSALVQGDLEDGQFVFRHGLQTFADTADTNKPSKYLLDIDYFKENVELAEVKSIVKNFNKVNFSFFDWCLGEKARKVLGEGKPK